MVKLAAAEITREEDVIGCLYNLSATSSWAKKYFFLVNLITKFKIEKNYKKIVEKPKVLKF